MKTLLVVFGAGFLVLVGIVVAMAIKGSALDAESKKYADTAFSAIVPSWNAKALEDRMSPEYKAAAKPGDTDKMFSMCRKLGKMNSFEGLQGQANISFTTEHGKVISAMYVRLTEFETGPAQIRLSLIKHENQWQIIGFHVNSKAFLQ